MRTTANVQIASTRKETEAATSLIVLTLLYAVLAVVEVKLLAKYIKRGAEPFEEPPDVPFGGSGDSDRPMAFAY